MDREVTIVRLYLKESDRGRSKRLLDELLDLLRGQGLPGVTVFRGVAGFGERGAAEADLLHLAGDLPLTVEFFDAPDKTEALMTAVAGLAPHLHIVHWRASARTGS